MSEDEPRPKPEESPTFGKRARRYWAPALVGVAFLGIIYFFGHILIPFIFALIIVYLIEPVVKRMHGLRIRRRQLPRWICVICVYLVFASAVSMCTMTVVPPLAREMSNLAQEAPRFFETLRRKHIPRLNQQIQGLLQRYFPAQVSTRQMEEVEGRVHHAVDRAETMALLLGAMTPEERESYRLGGTDVVIEGEVTPTREQPVAFRIRFDEENQEWLVRLDEVEVVHHPDDPTSYVLRMPSDDAPSRAGPSFDLEESVNESLLNVVELSGQGVAEIIGIGQDVVTLLLGAIVGIILTFMIAAFISMDLPGIMSYFRNLFPTSSWSGYDDLLRRLDIGLSGVVRGQLLICLVNGTLTTIGLLLFNVKFAWILGLIATVLSLIPIFGTIISTIPSVGMALTNGLTVALLVLGWILMIHFIEANILNPKIIGSQAHIHPVIVIFALLAGEHAYGLIGALLAVPVASIILNVFRFSLARSTTEAQATEEVTT